MAQLEGPKADSDIQPVNCMALVKLLYKVKGRREYIEQHEGTCFFTNIKLLALVTWFDKFFSEHGPIDSGNERLEQELPAGSLGASLSELRDMLDKDK